MLPGRPSDMSTLAWQPPGCGAMLCRLGLCEWMRSGTLEGVFEHLYSPWASSHPASVAWCLLAHVCVCTRHVLLLQCACLLMCVCAARSPSATAPTTGSPSPCRTHKSGALLSTYKCTLLANSMVKHKGGTQWELRAIGDFPNGAVVNIRVKSHYVAKDTSHPDKAAFTALDKLIAAEKAPVVAKKRAARVPKTAPPRRVSSRGAKTVELNVMNDTAMDGRANNSRPTMQQQKDVKAKRRFSSSNPMSFLSLSRHNAFMEGIVKKLQDDLADTEQENAQLVRTLSEAVAALQHPAPNENAPTQVRGKRLKMAVGAPHSSKKAFNNKVDSFQSMGMELLGGNTTRLQEVVKTLAARMNVQPEVVYANPMQMALYDAAQTYHQQLLDIGTKGSGSWTNMQRMCLDNIHNVLAMAIQRSAGAVSTSQVMASFSTTRRTLQLAAERLIISQEQDLPSALLRLKREVRNDKLPQAWFDFAIAFWSHESVARESEISKRRIRNPYTRKDKATYGLHFLTVLLKEEYKMMLVAARAHFNGLFYMSATINSTLRPFWVKNSTRETCLCIYHLKFMQAAEDLANFRQSLRASGKCKCTTPLLRQSADLWHTLLCPKKEGELCYQWECVNNRCEQCKNAKRLKESVLCNCVGGEERIKWKTYDKIDTGKERVAREDGDVSKVYRHDFVPRTEGGSETTPLEHYIVYFANDLWPEFVSHHDLALHQDYDWQQQRKNQPRHTCVTVEDFPENLTVSGRTCT